MHDQFMGTTAIQQPFLSCLPVFYTLAVSMSCYISNVLQVIKNIRNVTRHRNGQSVKSRQTRWEWQLLISIMHIHDVVTRYNIAHSCVHGMSTSRYSLPYHNVVLMRVTLMYVFQSCIGG